MTTDIQKIYISGPITGVKNYKQYFEEAAIYLQNKGYQPISPAYIEEEIGSDSEYSDYLRRALQLMISDGIKTIFFIEGWDNSRGCRIERNLAEALDFELIFEEDNNL